MSEQLAEADPVEVENQPEEFADAIAEAEARFDRAEIETLQRNLGIDPKPAKTENEQPAAKPAGPAPKSGKDSGFDKIISEAQSKLGKESAAAIRKVQSDGTKAATRAARAEKLLAEVNERLQRLEAGTQPSQPAAPDPLLARVTPQQWELFDKMAAERGWVRKEDLENAQQQETATEYNNRQVQEAYQQFGDRLGTFDEQGQFLLSDEAYEAIQRESDRVFNPAYGITAKDLFILANFEQLLEEARSAGQRLAPEEEAPVSRPEPRRRPAFTEQRSSAIGGKPVLYTRGKDSIGDVIRRASAVHLRGS